MDLDVSSLCSLKFEQCVECTRALCDFVQGDSTESKILELKRGDQVDPCREECLKFWVIVRGNAAICRCFADGRRQILSFEAAGSTVCGLLATPESPCWMEALDSCTVCELDFSSQARTLQSNPNFLRAMFDIAHTRLETTSRHLVTLGRLDSSERVLLFLAETAIKRWEKLVPSAPVNLTVSREDIADYLGLNAETVSRILGKFKKSKLVKFLSPTEYVIPDMAAIQRRLPVSISQPRGRATRSNAH